MHASYEGDYECRNFKYNYDEGGVVQRSDAEIKGITGILTIVSVVVELD